LFLAVACAALVLFVLSRFSSLGRSILQLRRSFLPVMIPLEDESSAGRLRSRTRRALRRTLERGSSAE